MGLTKQSTGLSALGSELKIEKQSPDDKVIALAGNPNVGKSTVFNSLTGLNQHTGNWPGKTVTNAQGRYKYNDRQFILVDIPGTYSLMANSAEEEVARDFVCFGRPDTVVVVADATCLERNLNLILQLLEITNNVVVCLNLVDEARRKKIVINSDELSRQLGVQVIPTVARCGDGLKELMAAVYNVSCNNSNSNTIKVSGASSPPGLFTISPQSTPLIKITYDNAIEEAIKLLEPELQKLPVLDINSRWIALKLLDGDENIIKSINKYLGYNVLGIIELSELLAQAKKLLNESGIQSEQFRDKVVTTLVKTAEDICSNCVTFGNKQYNLTDRRIDRILTSRLFGIPAMLCLLSIIFYLTISGANYPSELLSKLFFYIQDKLTELFTLVSAPDWLHGILVLGMYRTLAWVVAVMLPPMAIFFPLFTILEDLGYLPRIAFNLDNFFKKACACGKQALTMCMGFGCNAAGIVGCRIIDSPRERLIAILTNVFVPCNGRFPTLITIGTIFIGGTIGGAFRSLVSTLTLTGVVLLGIIMTLLISRLLSKTLLKGLPSSFTLELPPYRKPQLGRIIIRSIFDRTLFVLGRAAAVAAPAGLVIWLMSNITVNEISLLSHAAGFLDPFGRLMGLDGYIIMAFILGFPANEIVVPIILMSYMSSGTIFELNNLEDLRQVLVGNGWNSLTGICVMLFSLMHFPCCTTLWTIKRETESVKWTLAAFGIPTLAGITVCILVAGAARLLGLA